jgi:MFS family permease
MKMARVALAAVVVVLSTLAGVPLAASADESACLGTSLDPSTGREFFTPEQKYLAPPLRAFPPDCYVRIADRQFIDAPEPSYDYVLFYENIDYSEFVAIVRSFEEGGWGSNLVTAIDTGSGREVPAVGLTSAELAALPQPPLLATARFSDIRTGEDIVALTYNDGQAYQTYPTVTRPSLLIEFNGTRLFGATTGIADPSVLSLLRTIADLDLSPLTLGIIGGTSIFLMLIVGYPGAILGGVVSDRYDAFIAWLEKKRGVKRPPSSVSVQRRRPRWLFVPGLILASLIAGFVDPAFGPNPMSLRVFLTSLVSLAIFNVAAWSVVRAIMRRHAPAAKPIIGFRWGSLVLLVVAVIIARLLQFEPGIVFGLVAGLIFAVTLSASRKATVVLLGSGFALAISVLAWIAYSFVAPIAAAAPGNLALVSVAELLSGLTLEGISALPLALLPLLALDGSAIFAWKKWVWALSYVVGLAAFMLVILTVPQAWGQIGGDFGRWVLIYLIFGVVAVLVWAINAAIERRDKRAHDKLTSKPR